MGRGTVRKAVQNAARLAEQRLAGSSSISNALLQLGPLKLFDISGADGARRLLSHQAVWRNGKGPASFCSCHCSCDFFVTYACGLCSCVRRVSTVFRPGRCWQLLGPDIRLPLHLCGRPPAQ